MFEQNSPAPNDERVRFDESFRLTSRFFYGECSWIFRAAECFNRADIALWLPRYTNKRAEIEECGVEGPPVGFWKKTRGISPERIPARTGIDGFAKIEKPCQNSSGVSFDDWNGLIEAKAGHGMRGVFPDAGKLLHLLDFTRKLSSVSIHNRSRCAVEISRASVIAESLPRAKHVVFRSASQCGEIRKPAKPFVIIRDYGGDLGLLEHDLGDEDCVRVARTAPWQLAAVAAIPIQERALKTSFLESHSKL